MLGAVDLRAINTSPAKDAFNSAVWSYVDALSGVKTHYIHGEKSESNLGSQINGVICGGESGPGARPMHPEWARGLRDQCVSAGVPFFMKQMSQDYGKGFRDIESFPQDLQIRCLPNAI
jgi:protein gp37